MKSVPRVLHRLIVRWLNDEFHRAILVHIPSGWCSTLCNSSPDFECRTNFCDFFEHFKKITEPPQHYTDPKSHPMPFVMSGIIRAHGMRQSPFHHFFRRFVIFRPSQSYYDGNRDCDTSFTTGTGMSQLIVLGVIVAIMEKKFAIGIFVLSHIYR